MTGPKITNKTARACERAKVRLRRKGCRTRVRARSAAFVGHVADSSHARQRHDDPGLRREGRLGSANPDATSRAAKVCTHVCTAWSAAFDGPPEAQMESTL
jgi:hypothetical protein